MNEEMMEKCEMWEDFLSDIRYWMCMQHDEEVQSGEDIEYLDFLLY